jgi:hypothetical protein
MAIMLALEVLAVAVVLVEFFLLVAQELRGKATQALTTEILAPVMAAGVEGVLVLLALLLKRTIRVVAVLVQALYPLYLAHLFSMLAVVAVAGFRLRLLMLQAHSHLVPLVVVMVDGVAPQMLLVDKPLQVQTIQVAVAVAV